MSRKLHLIFALIAGLFILLGALTGAILAGESVYNQSLPYKSNEFEGATLAQTLRALKYTDVDALKLTVDRNHFVKVETTEGKTLFIHPQSAKVIEGNYKTPAFIQFVKTLHRSLYLGKTGRVVMGLTALCLLAITLSGLCLVLRKQKRWGRFFAKLPKERFYNYYHTFLGRWALLPIAIVCLTGVYMTLETVGVIPKFKETHNYEVASLREEPVEFIENIEAFNVPLSEVRSVDFPAFEDVEEVYKIDLIDKHLIVNQFTGEVISSSSSPFKSLAYLVRTLHIGKGHPIWAKVLLLTTLAILFFVYSGFAITLRKRHKGRNPFHRAECEYVVLVGSEGGTTRRFARWFHDELLRAGKRSYLADMNQYGGFEKLEQLVIFTCTYAEGEAPVNATRFAELWTKTPPTKPFGYSVVGFGSALYSNFCKYAKDVSALLAEHKLASCVVPLHTINDQNIEEFRVWSEAWAGAQDMVLRLPADFKAKPERKLVSFKLIERTPVQGDDIFMVCLAPQSSLRFASGDLLGITPEDGRERLYSVAKYEGKVWLSVKLHPQGVVSNKLNDLKIGDSLQAALVVNKQFHFPKKAPQVVCIANGVGMAPFIGMIAENTRKKPITLVWGCRREESLELYRPYIEQYTKEGKITTYWQAVSREGERFYVQDILQREGAMLAQLLQNKGVVMICGSMAMLKAVNEVLEQVCRTHLGKPLSYFENRKQIKTDCY